MAKPTMTDEQLEFFQALQAEFPANEVKKRSQAGRTFTYITNRMLFNRLDEVAGPTNWRTEYLPTGKGFVCTLWIRVPNEDGELVWLGKADGGGFAGMQEGDNDQKSGFSDAAKRAGMVWGIARYLYQDGSPDYMGDGPGDDQPPAQAPRGNAAPPARGNAAPPARGNPAPPARGNAAPPQGGQGGKQYDDAKPPTKGGSAVFAWAKKQETVMGLGAGFANEFSKVGEHHGYGSKIAEWSDDEAVFCIWEFINWVKTPGKWGAYNGQYDHLQDPRESPR